jgi:hypothetical protein
MTLLRRHQGGLQIFIYNQTDFALFIYLFSFLFYFQRTKKKMEEGGINKPHKRRQEAKVILARSETFSSTSNPQRASSGQAINQQRSYSFPSRSNPQRAPSFDEGASSTQQQPYVSNLESDSLTNHRQVANAGDASLEALWPLFVKIQPSLSSLLQDLANWDAASSFSAPNFDKPQETSSLAKTSQELEQIVLEEPSPTDWSKCSIGTLSI